MTGLLRLAHIATAIALIGGLFGRWVTLRTASRSRELVAVRSLLDAASVFEKTVTISSVLVLLAGLATAWSQDRPYTGEGSWWLLVSLLLYVSIVPLIPLVFVPRGKAFEAALTEAETQGQVTPGLTAAFQDPTSAAARSYEAIAIAVIAVLMITKPF